MMDLFDRQHQMNGPQWTACLAKGYNNVKYRWIEVLVMGKNQWKLKHIIIIIMMKCGQIYPLIQRLAA